jgi:hypothetical protein
MNALCGLALILLIPMCASCATPLGRFYKPGVSQADMNADHYACLQQATRAGTDVDGRLYNSCMQAKGYLKAE